MVVCIKLREQLCSSLAGFCHLPVVPILVKKVNGTASEKES